MKIGYSVPQSILSKIKFNSLYIYAQATNLFTITDTTVSIRKWGLQSYSSDYRNLDMGVDRGIYPLSRTFTFGVNVSFNHQTTTNKNMKKMIIAACTVFALTSCSDFWKRHL